MTRRTRPSASRRDRRSSLAAERLERRQLLSAALSVSNPLMVYNAVTNTNSPTETVNLTNVGDAPLTLGSAGLVLAGASPTLWTIANAAAAPATIAPGGVFGVQLTYRPTAVGRQTAVLDVNTNDPTYPTQVITLSGIGTAGRGGTSQPSLARILRAYNIPTVVGEGANDSAEAADSIYPNPPDATSQEVTLQRLVKAGTGPVTIQVLASFTADGAEPYTLGYYTPGSPQDRHELFYTPSTEAQSVYVHPQGSTSFDPGSSAFGMYFVSNVQVAGRIGYSEDSLNTWDTTNNRKFRFFPMKNPDGSAVPNAYVMTSTEWNAPSGYDFTNVVAVIRNVTAAPAGPTGPALAVTNPLALPGSTNVMFTNILHQNATLGDASHNTNTLTLANSGLGTLTVTGLTLSNTRSWSLVNPPALPLTLGPGATATVTIKYANPSVPATSYNETSGAPLKTYGGVESATLTVASTDPVTASRVIPLAGYTQYASENEQEPSLQSIVNLMAGYGTLINPTPIQELTQAQASPTATPTYYGEEVVSGYWAAADASRPVGVVELAAYHTQGQTANLNYINSSGGTTQILNQAADDGQTIFPLNASGTAAVGSFTNAGPFSFKVGGNPVEYSDDAKNSIKAGGGHHVRYFPVRDAIGNLVPNAYIMTTDYGQPTDTNFDFQDDVYLITNIRPASNIGAAAPAPTDAAAVNTTAGVALTWAPSLGAGVTGYNVYLQNPANGGFYPVNTSVITGTSFVDTTADQSVSNFYRVTAFVNGRYESQGTTAKSVAGPPKAPVYGNISGRSFDDANANGVADPGEQVLVAPVFIDLFGTNVYVPGVDPLATMDANGNYTFVGGLFPGTYTVVQIQPAYYGRTTGADRVTVTVAGNQVTGGVNFGAAQPGLIGGTIFFDYNANATRDADEPGIPNFNVYVDNNRNGAFDAGIDTRFYSGVGGTYATTPLPPGTYVLGMDLPAGWGRSTPALPATITVTERNTTTVNFGMTRGSLYGRVFNDANGNGVQDAGEAGIAGATVFLDYPRTGTFQAGDFPVTTDANGNWRVIGMDPGTYTVNVVPPSGMTRTSPSDPLGYTLTFYPGQLRTGVNFGLTATATPSFLLAGHFAAAAAASPFAASPATPLSDRLDLSN